MGAGGGCRAQVLQGGLRGVRGCRDGLGGGCPASRHLLNKDRVVVQMTPSRFWGVTSRVASKVVLGKAGRGADSTFSDHWACGPC